MKLQCGWFQRTSEPFLPICDYVHPIFSWSSLEVQSHRLEVSTLKLCLGSRDRVRRGKGSEKQSDEGLHGLSY